MSPVPVLLIGGIPTGILTGLVSGGAAALALAFCTRPVLRRLAEPTEDGGEPLTDKTAYADLATRAFVATTAVLGGLLTGLAATLLPAAAVPVWFVLGTAGLLLAAVDARTTWVPLDLTRVAWAATAGAALVGALLGLADGTSPWPGLLWGLAGAAIGAVFFGAVWWFSRGQLAFGDVRYAPIVGAAAGTAAPSMILPALVCGAIAGGLVGAVRLLGRRRGPFPYAPAIFAGAWLALLVDQLSRQLA